MSTVRQYELIYIAPPEASEELLAELHQLVADVVEQFQGTIESTENWGRRKLAYEIGGQREGVYVLEVINGPADLNVELDRRLRVADQVMRHMVVRVDEEKQVAERIQSRRKRGVAARRVRRGLPPEPIPVVVPSAAEVAPAAAPSAEVAPAAAPSAEVAPAAAPSAEVTPAAAPSAEVTPADSAAKPPGGPVATEGSSEGGTS
jgi:small subunit ribosomal protein S6